ncbi:unnamed protein product [Polarella glacialis]|uniref:RanBP2-type domain-containing protein n=1 Tax=Polarella glacialis TaxID=89957 RepID=A0A813GNG9_POLGL|nr:unnamed protein product [Polarella glacialis]
MVSPTLIFNGSISGFVGVLLGIIISLIVNCTLVEISISSFFSLYFGFLFVVVGGIILWRIFSQDSADSKESQAKRRPLAAFALIIILSGLICFTLEQHWYRSRSPLMKVPLYTILGTAVAFVRPGEATLLSGFLQWFYRPVLRGVSSLCFEGRRMIAKNIRPFGDDKTIAMSVHAGPNVLTGKKFDRQGFDVGACSKGFVMGFDEEDVSRDWNCPGCNERNFLKRFECHRCHTPKPLGREEAGVEVQDAKMQRRTFSPHGRIQQKAVGKLVGTSCYK